MVTAAWMRTWLTSRGHWPGGLALTTTDESPAHQRGACRPLSAQLDRLELQEALRGLISRMPGLQLANQPPRAPLNGLLIAAGSSFCHLPRQLGGMTVNRRAWAAPGGALAGRSPVPFLDALADRLIRSIG
jgi:hypothetical protein